MYLAVRMDALSRGIWKWEGDLFARAMTVLWYWIQVRRPTWCASSGWIVSPYATMARIKFGDGRVGEVRRAADIARHPRGGGIETPQGT